MTNNIDHDRLFKELISTFFLEFIELFFPQVMDYLDRDSITFLDKEVFTDVTEGERYESDLVAQVKFRGKESFFLIHVEAQESSRNGLIGECLLILLAFMRNLSYRFIRL
ncbi:hypothetical protein O53_4779 [Microcystis aeruginosa TAIHU98]|uniref:Transposase n=1 Tax=Microcystis aeruginosa TAIHU98 TaxID=1134457 RepID=L7E0U3_MICAE|nr:hypothetical protein O53_4779 [Microcystis aeruginosa TAIHU98]